MCGIVFTIYKNENTLDEEEWRSLVHLNAQRGPSAQKEIKHQIEAYNLSVFSSVLHLRGDKVAMQPHERGGNIFCWNGEIFEGIDVNAHENDGMKLFDQLCQPDATVADILGTVEGPYAFVFYQRDTNIVYFGRDPLGRRSLVVKLISDAQQSLTIASVSNGDQGFEELPANCLFSLSLAEPTLKLHQVPRKSADTSDKFTAPRRLCPELPPPNHPIPADPLSKLWRTTVNEYLYHLDQSVALRTQDIPRYNSLDATSSRVAVLFSGGIDSTVIAFLAHRHLPVTEPIDLLNVAFENPRTLNSSTPPSSKRNKKSKSNESPPVVPESTKYMVPDRITGLAQLEEFRRLAPDRIWNFVEINIPYEESTAHRETIEQLMAPSKTIMDFSLAQALYFASRGRGYLRKGEEEAEFYDSPARVILSGLGADELIGGYIRHKNAFKHGQWQGLLDELQLDVDRIHTRNLGRDDRIIASHGKETRYPYLSLSLIAFLSNLPIYLKVDPRVVAANSQDGDLANWNEITSSDLAIAGLPGDKLLHRLAARQLRLEGAARRAKRAMQFGSRSARMEGGEGNKKIKGNASLN
ncbi:hypothetical protein CPB86DRAFT_721197 [Serendipita vermifera]|nr:hypothetical protein CPB86DRAFT_721197 [Serendipita vermifera]